MILFVNKNYNYPVQIIDIIILLFVIWHFPLTVWQNVWIDLCQSLQYIYNHDVDYFTIVQSNSEITVFWVWEIIENEEFNLLILLLFFLTFFSFI
jgi:hypothetical protein